MADPITIFGVVTSLFSIVSCTYTIILLSREWKRRVEFTRELSDVHQREIEVLQRVRKECQEIANSATHVPSSIKESFATCASREKSLISILVLGQGTPSHFANTLRLSLQKKDLKRRYGMFRESVLLLRDLCLELRTQQQLVDMSAGMARLAADVLEENDDEMDVQEHENSALPANNSNRSNKKLISALRQLGKSNYVVKATVVVQHFSQERGQRFRYISAEAEHTPALVKLDTGSDVDVVSQEFLTQAGFGGDTLKPIPAEEKDSFIGIEGTPYRPGSRIELFWFREGEQRIRKNLFYVVSGAPVDILLGSRKFAEEAAKRVALFTGPPKSKATIALEQQRETERLQEAAQAEETRFQEELRRRQARNGAQPPRTSNGEPYIELGLITPASSIRRSD